MGAAQVRALRGEALDEQDGQGQRAVPVGACKTRRRIRLRRGVGSLKTFVENPDPSKDDLVNWDVEVEGMTHFYGMDFDDDIKERGKA
jgi:hypothetical protein